MNTGTVAILMRQLPYQFNGLPILATIMDVFTLVRYVMITSVTTLRWTVYRQAATRNTAGNIDDISFLGLPPIAFLTITELTALIVISS